MIARVGLFIVSDRDDSEVVRGGGAVGEPRPSSRDRVRDLPARKSGAVVDVEDAGDGDGDLPEDDT